MSLNTTNEAGITTELLDAITKAYNDNNIDDVMRYFADDAIFDHGAGGDIHGTRFVGKERLTEVFSGLFNNVNYVQWESLDTRIVGNKAYCEFHRKAELKSGEIQDFLSVDVLTFRDGLIIHKDTYFKNRV